MRPLCKHSLEADGHDPTPMTRNGRRPKSGSQKWRCDRTPKRSASQKRYEHSDKGKATKATRIEEYKAAGLCRNGDGRPARRGYVQCAECVTFANTNPRRVLQKIDAHNRGAQRLREERLAGKVAEIEAIQKRIRDAN